MPWQQLQSLNRFLPRTEAVLVITVLLARVVAHGAHSHHLTCSRAIKGWADMGEGTCSAPFNYKGSRTHALGFCFHRERAQVLARPK